MTDGRNFLTLNRRHERPYATKTQKNAENVDGLTGHTSWRDPPDRGYVYGWSTYQRRAESALPGHAPALRSGLHHPRNEPLCLPASFLSRMHTHTHTQKPLCVSLCIFLYLCLCASEDLCVYLCRSLATNRNPFYFPLERVSVKCKFLPGDELKLNFVKK
jgi:hypothetical protein